MATIRMTLEEVVGYFDELEDPHPTIDQKHPFINVVVISLTAILAGASGPTTIAQWARYKEAFLRRVLDLPNGVPRKDVFRRVLSLLNPTAFQTCFAAWLTRLREQAAEVTETGGKWRATKNNVLAVEGANSLPFLVILGRRTKGWVVGHALVGAAAPTITEYTGVAVGFVQFAAGLEVILIPALIVLASLVGFLPAFSAYRTDVARAVTASP